MARFERGARQPRGHRRPDAFDIPAHAACLKRGGRRRNGPFVRAAQRDRAKVMSTETLIEPPLQDADALIAAMGARARAAAKIMANAPPAKQADSPRAAPPHRRGPDAGTHDANARAIPAGEANRRTSATPKPEPGQRV